VRWIETHCTIEEIATRWKDYLASDQDFAFDYVGKKQ